MDNIAGPPVEGDNFFGREADIARLCELLSHHDILLLGPRRIGKTSVARATMAAVQGASWHTIEVNVASCADEGAFLDKLTEAVRTEGASWVGQAFFDWLREAPRKLGNRIESVKIPVPGAGSLGVGLAPGDTDDWTRVASELLRRLVQAEEPWLIYIDELPILLFNLIRDDPQTGVQRVRRFLDWFRNDVRALPGSSKVRWLVSGSVGLDTLVQRYGMADTINSLHHQGLAPFSEPAALAMLARLAEHYRIQLPAAEAQRLLDAIRWLQPYYLQLAFNHLRVLIQATGSDLAQCIDQAVEEMVQPGWDNDFHHWEQRLSIQLGPQDGHHAIALLDLAARNPLGERPETLLATLAGRLSQQTAEEAMARFLQLRDILQRDAYWWPDESSGNRRYRFCLEPLRCWWARRHSL